MEVNRPHIYAPGPLTNNEEPKSFLDNIFKQHAPIQNTDGRSLKGRVTKPDVTSRGKNLSDHVRKITAGVPSPLLINSTNDSKYDNR